jgi:outer membrane lipoprotein-sorting protein
VESTPQNGWWYGRVVRCIDEKTFMPVRTEYYDRSGALWKVREFSEIEMIDGYRTWTRLTMETVPTRTSTSITLSDVEYDTGLSPYLFETR